MNRLKVYVVAPTLGQYHEVANIAVRAGFDVGGAFDHGREANPEFLSTEDTTSLADQIAADITQADVVVSVHNRAALAPAHRGASFYAGFAYARGIPVVVVGPFSEVGLHASRINVTDLDGLNALLIRIEKSKNDLRVAENFDTMGRTAAVGNAVLRGAMMAALTHSTQTGESDGNASADSRGSEGSAVGDQQGGGSPVDDVADGSHV